MAPHWAFETSVGFRPLSPSINASCLRPSMGPNRWAIKPFGACTDCRFNRFEQISVSNITKLKLAWTPFIKIYMATCLKPSPGISFD